jgi:molecular chaperone DnaJ
MKDYYKILEVEENASEEEIKKSYRTLSKKYHPDVNPDGSEKFKEILDAYNTLSNKNKRNEYDFFRKNPNNGNNVNDIFSQFFNQRQRNPTTADKIITLNITPIESYKGSEKTIQYHRDEKCEPCGGRGGEQQLCSSCGGQGFQVKTFSNGFMVQQVRTNCATCGGRGYSLVHKCNYCDGRGYEQKIGSVFLNLPHGIDNGQFIKVPQGGDFRNGKNGDLMIQIQVISSDGFEKIGNDLVYNLFVNYDELLFDKYKIPHPDGDMIISSPKVVDTSKPLRVKGKGYNGNDMYIKLNVRFERKS